MADLGYNSHLSDSLPGIGHNINMPDHSSSMPTVKRKIYSNYDKKAYMQDLHEIIRLQMSKDQQTNPHQKLMMKRNQRVAHDDFKEAERKIKVDKRVTAEQPEKGMGLLNRNLEREKLEREAIKQQYRHDIMKQIKEKEGVNTKYRLLDKISHMPPAIYSASQGHPEQSISRPNPPNRNYQDGYHDHNQEGASQQDRYREDDRNQSMETYTRPTNLPNYGHDGDNYGQKPQSGQHYERVPSANEYYSVSIPDNYQQRQPSTFQKASASNLGSFNRRHPSPSLNGKGENDEFFDKFFGSAHDQKKIEQQQMKNRLVNELQAQMELKKERERREKAARALEDMKAEERYVKELSRINEQRQSEVVKPSNNIFAEGLTDTEVMPENRREPDWASPRPISIQDLPKEPEYSKHRQPEASIHNKHQTEYSLVSKGPEKSRMRESSQGVSREMHPTHGSRKSISNPGLALESDPIASAMQQYQQPPSKYLEYNQRVNDFQAERADDKRKELRMNTNLLYQQLIDLRGEKNYSDNLKQQAFQNFDTVKRNLEKQNRQLNHDLQALIGGEGTDTAGIADLRGGSKAGLGSSPQHPRGLPLREPSKLDQYRQQGLKMVEDLYDPSHIRSNGNLLDYRTEIKEGGFVALDDGEIIMSAETQLIPISYKQVDRMSLDKFAMMNPDEMSDLVKKEARQDRITAQISYQTPEERLEDLKRRNLDFDTLMNEMSKECRHIYEDEIGVRPVKKGQGVDTLDQIIDNLYNDQYRVKNLPPKEKGTNTEEVVTRDDTEHGNDKVDSPSFFNPDKKSSGLYTEKYNLKVTESPKDQIDWSEGNPTGGKIGKKEPNMFSMEDADSPSEDNRGKSMPGGSQTSLSVKDKDSSNASDKKGNLEGQLASDILRTQKPAVKPPIPQIVVNTPKGDTKPSTALQPEMSFGEGGYATKPGDDSVIGNDSDVKEKPEAVKVKETTDELKNDEEEVGAEESNEEVGDEEIDDGEEEEGEEEEGDDGTEEKSENEGKDGTSSPNNKDPSESGNSTPLQGNQKGLLKKGVQGEDQLQRSESKKKVTFSELPS